MSAWDFYPTTIDDRPASIYVDLAHRRIGPPVGADTHFVARVAMLDLGSHGMGTGEESAVLHVFEDALEKRLAAHEIIYVGRIRTHGVWEMSFYGPAASRAHFVVEPPERVCRIAIEYDPAWSRYSRTILCARRSRGCGHARRDSRSGDDPVQFRRNSRL